MPSAEVKVACAESSNERAGPTVVDEIIADKNAINLRVVTQVSHVYLAALVAMFGGRLTPPVRGLVAMVDVVAVTLFEGCPLIRAFVQKAGIVLLYWSLVKRALYGQHHHYSKEHAAAYFVEACHKYNIRNNPNQFDDFLAGAMAV